MSHIVVMITTYNRPVRLGWLLDDIARMRGAHQVEVFVWDDGSAAPLAITPDENVHICHSEHRGKAQYWQTCTRLYQWVRDATLAKRGKAADYYCQLPDDVRLAPRFFDEMIAHWEAIDDPWKICLNPLCDRRAHTLEITTTYASGRTEKQTVEAVLGNRVEYGPYVFRCAPWVDCCWWGTERFLGTIRYAVPAVPPSTDPRFFGSSVGPFTTYTIFECDQRFTMYHLADYTLAHHSAHRSMATYKHPARMASIHDAVASIMPQVHGLHIYANGYTEDDVPDLWRDEPRIQVYLSDAHMGDLGDLGKFYAVRNPALPPGYFLSIDDDIVYPPHYVATLLQELEAYGRGCIVGWHGVMFEEFPVHSYYRNRRVYHNQVSLADDTSVVILGTGCMAFHLDVFRPVIWPEMHRGMADIYIAQLAQEREIPMVCLAHPRKSVTILDVPDTIYDRYRHTGDDHIQTRLVNAQDWRLFPLPRKLLE